MTKLRSTSFSSAATDSVKFMTLTDDHTLATSDFRDCGHLIVLADGSSNSFTITLPSDTDGAGNMLHIVASDVTNSVDIDANDGTLLGTIDTMGEYFWKVFSNGGGGTLKNNT